MKIKRIRTPRGFMRVEFNDLYDEACSLQESSLATQDAIWLGWNEQPVYDIEGNSCCCRMHLNREQAAWLIRELQHFVETGEVRDIGTDGAEH